MNIIRADPAGNLDHGGVAKRDMLLAWFQGLFTSRVHGSKRRLGLCNWQFRAESTGG